MRINRVTLAAEMARREWRDKRLSELSGVSRATVSAIRGGKTVSFATAQKIARTLNMPVDRLIEQEGTPRTQYEPLPPLYSDDEDRPGKWFVP